MMLHVHPFPARMAPEIALGKIKSMKSGSVILDPMSGSGMVLSQSARLGFQSVGCDLDPLARLISKATSTRLVESKVHNAIKELLSICAQHGRTGVHLPWIDEDLETKEFIKYWFARKQVRPLRLLSYYLVQEPFTSNKNVIDIIKIAVSRLIISKEPKASLARDTAHSRPHRTIDVNDFDILKELPASIAHVLNALNPSKIKTNSRTYLADARSISRLPDKSVDVIITSPPYLNAIDYMRGHKFSLIWFGYNLSKLRKIRSKCIGTEKSQSIAHDSRYQKLMADMGLKNIHEKENKLIYKYYIDLSDQLDESYRLLRNRKTALYVIGNSSLRGNYIKNSDILKYCAAVSGFKLLTENIRKIPDNHRYLPVTVNKSNSLSKRMRTEHIIEFRK